MSNKRIAVEHAIHHLRKTEVLLAQGRTVARPVVTPVYWSRATSELVAASMFVRISHMYIMLYIN